MRTGCQGPFCHGTGGWCGCNCKCCPPPCCPVIAVRFSCGSDCGPHAMAPQFPAVQWNVPSQPLPKLPDFSLGPIISEDGTFSFHNTNCSIPCETVCVELRCGGSLPCCCLELLNGQILAVGNGYVTAPTTVNITDCGIGYVYINGLPPPVFVQDCELITVSIVTSDPLCCICHQVNISCGACPPTMLAMAPLWKRKIDKRTGKVKVSPSTGKPVVVISKDELRRRVKNRLLKSRRKK
jgi:hypothetical protein